MLLKKRLKVQKYSAKLLNIVSNNNFSVKRGRFAFANFSNTKEMGGYTHRNIYSIASTVKSRPKKPDMFKVGKFCISNSIAFFP